MRVLQILTPCTDDFFGPFPDQEAAAQWAEKRGLRTGEWAAHSMESPDSGAADTWARLPEQLTPNPWQEDSVHPVVDWVYEAGNGDTRLGYADWLQARREAERDTWR